MPPSRKVHPHLKVPDVPSNGSTKRDVGMTTRDGPIRMPSMNLLRKEARAHPELKMEAPIVKTLKYVARPHFRGGNELCPTRGPRSCTALCIREAQQGSTANDERGGLTWSRRYAPRAECGWFCYLVTAIICLQSRSTRSAG